MAHVTITERHFSTSEELRTLDFSTICENCSETLGEHKAMYCVTGPRNFKTIIPNSFYKGELRNRQ